MISVVILEDHSLFRMTLKMAFTTAYPDIRIVGEAEDGDALFRLLKTTTADIVLLDIALPGMSGIEVACRLREEYPGTKIFVISAEGTAENVKALLSVGIEGFISKQAGGVDEIAQAIHSIMSGIEYFGKDISTIIYEIYVSKKKNTGIIHEFTAREREIILLCRDGLLAKQIAERLGISLNTVHNHKKNIFHKLGINSTMEMVQYALKHRIITIN